MKSMLSQMRPGKRETTTDSGWKLHLISARWPSSHRQALHNCTDDQTCRAPYLNQFRQFCFHEILDPILIRQRFFVIRTFKSQRKERQFAN